MTISEIWTAAGEQGSILARRLLLVDGDPRIRRVLRLALEDEGYQVGYGYFGDSRIVDVHVRRLRVKVERDPASPQHVVTARGLGYRLLG